MKKDSIFKDEAFLWLAGSFGLFLVLTVSLMIISECTGWGKPKPHAALCYVDLCHPDIDRAIEVEIERSIEREDREAGRDHHDHQAIRDLEARQEREMEREYGGKLS